LVGGAWDLEVGVLAAEVNIGYEEMLNTQVRGADKKGRKC
jgi:hypothetical protein